MSNFSWTIDGGIVGLYLLLTMAAGLYVRKYVSKVDDFLVAGREMNLYLGIASLAATEFGIVTCMYAAQAGYLYGFAGATPGIAMAVSMLIVGYTGFCIKPLRDSGVITLPELIEKRFGPGVRWASGVVIVLGGLLNMGVFLRVGGEFLVTVTGLNPDYLEITMTLLLVGVALYTIFGGMLSVLVTDFMQFIVMSTGLVAVTLLILTKIGWQKLADTVQINYGTGGFNPFQNPDLGWQYVLFQVFVSFAAVLTWQTMISRVLAAKNTKTGQRVYVRTSFFFVCRFLIPAVWGIAALATVGQMPNSMEAMPTFLSEFVPIGLMGLCVAAMLAADMSTDSSYMLTWGSVIYNDILAPFRKGKWSEKRGLFWNRTIVALIGVFLLFYGLWYPLKGDIWKYLGLTGSIYLASMSVILISSCYWKRANSWGAIASIIIAAVIPTGYLVLENANPEMAATIGGNTAGASAYILSALGMFLGSSIKNALGGKQ